MYYTWIYSVFTLVSANSRHSVLFTFHLHFHIQGVLAKRAIQTRRVS